MVDTVITTMGNDNDDWEVAVESGEFDKRLEQHRTTTQDSISSFTVNDDSSNIHLIQSNKPIRILKRPTNQSQLPVTNDTISTNNNNSTFSNTISSSTTVPIVSIIPQINSSSSQAIKPVIKTYEQREQEYRLARLRIMGEEESSIQDSTIESPDEPINSTSSTSNQSSDSSATSTAAICFTPNINSTGPFSQQQYHSDYYSQQSLAPPPPHYSTTTFYMPPPILSLTNWYPYQQQQQTPYGTQQYGYPQ